MNRLKERLNRIHGRGYKAYKDIRGDYDWPDYTLFVDLVQGDPFASPSRVRVRVPLPHAGFRREVFDNSPRRIAFCDYLTRRFSQAIRKYNPGVRGTGSSGALSMVRVGQEILHRSSIVVTDDWVEARFRAGLPAHGRRVDSRLAHRMFFEELPKIVESSLLVRNLEPTEIEKRVEFLEDVEAIRDKLRERKLVSFVADGSVLPRKSGVDDRPMDDAVAFTAPETLKVSFKTPNHGEIEGMGIPEGVTLIVGGGYHGKSTLLRAIERGVYPHIPGDGREWVVTDPTAFKIRAEDGRYIERVDISPFIGELPRKGSTKSFSTEDASGSTSQAANIIEATEAGARVLLIDEDTSATNFMIRDHRMQKLVSKEKEPITPFVDRVQSLYRNTGISTILVLGGSGDYLDVADRVILMDNYLPRDSSDKAREVAARYPTNRVREGTGSFELSSPRRPLPRSFDPSRGKRDVKIQAKGKQIILFGKSLIDLSCVEQLVDEAQTRAIGDAIHWLSQNCFARDYSVPEALDYLRKAIDRDGLDIFDRIPRGDYAVPRRLELACAINRLRTLKVSKSL
jgi:predicted ABC-class ATPase